jgi:phospholipid/cholesterol/gamma-HCH transport system substrate-binding protein
MSRTSTASVRLRLLVFALVGGLAVVVAGVRYAGLWEAVSPSSYEVRVELQRSGGIFERAEVTYRGVTVGRVREVEFRRDGVTAVLALDDDVEIPAALTANVHNRSAVGEQYVDLVPTRDDGPDLADGDVISAVDTTTPVSTAELLVAVDSFLQSVPRRDLSVVVRELDTTFSGAGRDLRALIRNSATILDEAEQVLPATGQLLADAGTVLQTQSDQSELISAALRDLAILTAVFGDQDDDVRTILVRAAAAAKQLRLLAAGLAPHLPPLLDGLAVVAGIAGARVAEMEETLVALPYALASALTPGRGERAHFAYQGSLEPRPCRDGYVPPARWRSPHDLLPVPMDDGLHCTERGGVLPRGSNSELDED